MPDVLTLVACSSEGSHVLPDGNDFLRQVHTAQRKLESERPGAVAVGAITCVNEIRPFVQAAATAAQAPCTLQLVGHGRPGELELSYSWHRRYRDELRFYVLDNTSRQLALLAGCRGSIDELRLVACDLGDEAGHPLMFTLSKLLDCEVTAALGSVTPQTFHPHTGLYVGPVTICARGTQRFRVRTTPPRRGPRASARNLGQAS